MKESELIEMKRKIEALSRIAEFLLKENENLRTLATGTFQTIKEMPDYKDAVMKLAERINDQQAQDKKRLEDENGKELVVTEKQDK